MYNTDKYKALFDKLEIPEHNREFFIKYIEAHQKYELEVVESMDKCPIITDELCEYIPHIENKEKPEKMEFIAFPHIERLVTYPNKEDK